MFLQTYQPNPIMFTLGPLQVHYYGFLIASAIILGFLISVRLAKKYKIKKDQVLDLYFYLIIFGLIGARAYHVLCEWQYYLANPIQIPQAWRGGLGIFGGIFAGLAVVWVYSKKITAYSLQLKDSFRHASTFWLLLEILSPALILGLAIGRWGNYFNQELFGPPCSYFWCIPIDIAHRPAEFIASTHFHPTFLYESLYSFAIFTILLFMHKVRIKKSPHDSSLMTHDYHPGTIFLSLIVLYTLFRFFNEFLRIDQQPEAAGLRLSQWVSAALFMLGISLLINKLKKTNKPRPQLPVTSDQ